MEKIKKRISKNVKKSVEIEDGYIFEFEHTEQNQSDLDNFIDHEVDCCTFLDFHKEINDDNIVCTVRCNDTENYELEIIKEVIYNLFI